MSLSGRGAELKTIDGAVAATAGGTGGVLVLAGEAGIGKTALLGELTVRARGAGLTVLAARAAEHEREVPFGLVVDALDDHVGGLSARRLEGLGAARLAHLGAVLPSMAESAASLEAMPDRFYVQRALRALIELLARSERLVLVIDDVQWADEASVEWMLNLVRKPLTGPVLVVLATRPVEPLPRLADALRAHGAGTLVEVGPIPDAVALEMAAHVGGPLAERIVAAAAGNPLFLQELARVAHDPDVALPRTVMAAVELEVGALPPASRALLDGAAVAGDPFDPELAAAAADLGLEDGLAPLDRLVMQGLVHKGVGRSFAFRHPLVRRAVYEATPAGWRLEAHERAAHALAERGAPPLARAFHVEHAARPGDADAIALLTQAGDDAIAGSPASAAHWFEAALRLVPDSQRDLRRDLTGRLARVRAASGDLAGAREAFNSALELLPDRPTPEGVALFSSAVLVDYLLGFHASARDRLASALQALPYDAPPPARVGLEMGLIAFASEDRDATALMERSERVKRLASGWAPATVASAHAYTAYGHHLAGDPDAAAAELDEATTIFRALDDHALVRWPAAPYVLGWQQVTAERPADALESVTRGMVAARGRHQDMLYLELETVAGTALVELCRIDEALVHLDNAEEMARLGHRDRSLADVLWVRALALDLAGETSAADRAASECRSILERLEPMPSSRVALAALARRGVRDDPRRARDEILRVGGDEVDRLDPTHAVRAMVALASAETALGDRVAAARWADRALGHADEYRLPLAAGRARAAWAEVAGDLDAMRAAADALDEAGGVADALAVRVRIAELDEDGDHVASLREVLERVTGTGAGALAQAAARELRKRGVHARARVTAGAGSFEERLGELTPREREIAQLVADGRSNKAVAASLFLSEKTIEHNLTTIYAKLGLRSRVELAAALARGGAS